MIKNIILIALMLIQFNCMSQTYIIPWATKQPAWVFPIWVEDALGNKDTIFICYDNTANSLPCTKDTGFGEETMYVQQNNKLFLTTCQTTSDSAIRAQVTSVFGPGLPFGIDLEFRSTTFPIIIRWDRSLLNSDSLPFPSQTPAPRAQLAILAWVNNNIIPACGSSDILASDSCISACCQPDSVIIDNSVSGIPTSSAITCIIMPWTGILGGIVEEIESNLISITPNPSKGVIKISSYKLINKLGFMIYMVITKNW
nr:hypothetical protein [Bacteroidota bacterium]